MRCMCGPTGFTVWLLECNAPWVFLFKNQQSVLVLLSPNPMALPRTCLLIDAYVFCAKTRIIAVNGHRGYGNLRPICHGRRPLSPTPHFVVPSTGSLFLPSNTTGTISQLSLLVAELRLDSLWTPRCAPTEDFKAAPAEEAETQRSAHLLSKCSSWRNRAHLDVTVTRVCVCFAFKVGA